MKKMSTQPIEPNTGKFDITVIQSLGQPCVDSRILDKRLGNRHESAYGLIKRYEADFLELGILRIEIQATKGREQAQKYALLNEDQCYLLLSHRRNTPELREFKISLIQAFREARYGMACQSLLTRKQEASQSGRRLAHWRYEKSGMHRLVTHLGEQLKLPLDLDGGQQLF